MRRAAGSGPARAGVPASTLEARAAAPPSAAARTRLARDAASAFAFAGPAPASRTSSDCYQIIIVVRVDLAGYSSTF